MEKEITIETNTFGADLVAAILYEHGSEGVAIYDTCDIAELSRQDLHWDYIEDSVLEQSEIVRVVTRFAEEGFAGRLFGINADLAALKTNAVQSVGSLCVQVSDSEAYDWTSEWKKNYRPIEVGRYLIVPEWMQEERADKIRILMDPGMAFGTGQHESTRMCLSMLSALFLEGKQVIDAGCGSGILGIAAVLSGAKHACLIDIDAQALENARHNAESNGVSGSVRFINSKERAWPAMRADVVLANITADVLVSLCAALPQYLAPQADILLSGILDSRLAEVCDAYLAKGYSIEKTLADGEWRALWVKYGN